jgi:hypothetical protein
MDVHAPCHESNTKNDQDGMMQVVDEAITDSQGHVGIYTGSIMTSTMLPHGKGCMQYTQLDRSYDGEWSHGQRHGTGKATFPNGDTYDGEYVYDKREGTNGMGGNIGRHVNFLGHSLIDFF